MKVYERSAMNMLVRQDPENNRIFFTIKEKNDWSQNNFALVSPRGNSMKEIANYIMLKKKEIYKAELDIYAKILLDTSSSSSSTLSFGSNPVIKVNSIENIDRNLFWVRKKNNGKKERKQKNRYY